MEANGEPAIVELTIPCKPEYVGVARLAILGVASRMKFSYDQVEDVRLAVGEACTTSVEWAAKNGRQATEILVRSSITDSRLIVDIIDKAGERQEEQVDDGPDIDFENLGPLIIALLVDEVTVNPQDGGTQLRMVKYAGK